MEPQETTYFQPFKATYQGIRADGKRCVVTIPVNKPKRNSSPLMDAVEKVMRAIGDDNRRKFSCRLAEAILQENMASKKTIIGQEIINEEAIECACAVVDGDTSHLGLDPDFGFDAADGWTPVHQAAVYIGNDEMMRLLLENDYSADVRGQSKNYSFKLGLPLNVALHQLRFTMLNNFLASPDMSAPSLLEKLYTLDRELEVVRMLALKTREFKNEFFNYAKEGKMIEVGALLLAAGEKLMPLSISKGEDNLAFGSFEEISRFLLDKNNNIDEFAELKETVKLLDIYDKIGYQLSTYVALKENRRSGVEVAALLKDAGFVEKIDDHNIQDYVNRSKRASFELKVPKSFWDPYLAYCEKKMYLSNWLNKMVQRFPSRAKSQHPSMSTKQLTDTTLFNHNMGASHQFGTVATKVVNAMQKFNSSSKYGSWPWLKKFFPRR